MGGERERERVSGVKPSGGTTWRTVQHGGQYSATQWNKTGLSHHMAVAAVFYSWQL